MMRFYQQQHSYYCGVDLHARTMHVCVVDATGLTREHVNLPCDPGRFLKVIEPYRDQLVVSCECLFAWYWLADLCRDHGITFVLGHALYMKAIHGGKAKTDKIDSEKIARLLKGGNLPQAYVYPKEMRATRDLLRRRMKLMRLRGQALAHVTNTFTQYNLPSPEKRLSSSASRIGVAERFGDDSVQYAVRSDLALAQHLDDQLCGIERYLVEHAKIDDPQAFARLQTVPGIGPILALVLLYEIHDIRRFATVQRFVSYCRLVKCAHESAGKLTSGKGNKIGNAHLKWAFSEASLLMLRELPAAKSHVARLEKKHGKAKAISILFARLGRTVYWMLKRKEAFDANRFWK
jgi:transposase